MSFHREEETLKKVDFNVWRQILKFILKSKKDFFRLVMFAVMLAFIEVFTISLNKYALETFIKAKDFSTLTPFIIISVAHILAFAGSVFGFIYSGGILEAKVNYVLRKETFKNLQKLPFSYYDNTKQGWIMARMTSDTRRLSGIISWGILDLTWSVFYMVFVLVLLFMEHWQLALIITSLLPVLFLITALFRKRVLRLNRKARFYNSEVTGLFNESFLGVKTTKSLAIENELSGEFIGSAKRMKNASVSAVFVSALFSSSLLSASYTIVALVMTLGGYFLLQEPSLITIGTLFVFIRATMNFFDPVLNLTRFVSDLQVAQASAERVLQLVNEVPAIDDTPEVKDVYGDLFNKKKENWEEIEGEIEFKNVSFYYEPSEVILNSFNLKVKPGQSVALVGHTGSGKTTIVNLLARFYEPQSGQILIDGVDYKDRSISWLHTQLGYVLQSPELFSTTIKENIRYGNLDATDAEVYEASKLVGFDEFVATLPLGYDTHVGEGGNLLSVGQKQLISFARAIIADPRILILDEATSSIDSEAEHNIKIATDQLLIGRTSFIVAHRLSTIVSSDVIILLDQGEIIEMGTHHELLANRGPYFNLYKDQFIQEKSFAVVD